MRSGDRPSPADRLRIRRYAVPPRMIAECAAARARGDWRAVCEAGRVDVTFAPEVAAEAEALAAHLAPDLLRWHLPRALGGFTTLANDERYLLIPDGPVAADAVLLRVRAPVSVLGSQRLRLDAIRRGQAGAVPVPACLWDARHAGGLRAALDGPADRGPMLAAIDADLELIRQGRLAPGALHPLVREVLFPGVPAQPAEPFPGADGELVRVRCRGERHEIVVRLGRLDLRSHSPAEQQRERAMRAFGGRMSGCFAAETAWSGAPGRLPRRLGAHREDLWQRMIHGGTRTVLDLLDAGMDPHVRDSAGGTLMHRLRSFDHRRLLPRLLAAGLDVDARDCEGGTPLYVAVVHRGPGSLITALVDAGADPYLPNQHDDTVIAHVDDLIRYRDDLEPDFEDAVAYLRRRV